MPRKPKELTPDQIRDKADKAEGLRPPESEIHIGRPPTYEDTFAKQVEKLCILGATDVDLADFFDVTITTIKRWKVRHEAFGAALKVGKASADDRVEHSLYQRAVGYTFDSEKVQIQRDGTIVRASIREHVPPDTTAQIFWLKNRRTDLWRDVQKHEHGEVGAFDAMSADDLRASIAADLTAIGRQDLAAALVGGEGETRPAGRPH